MYTLSVGEVVEWMQMVGLVRCWYLLYRLINKLVKWALGEEESRKEQQIDRKMGTAYLSIGSFV